MIDNRFERHLRKPKTPRQNACDNDCLGPSSLIRFLILSCFLVLSCFLLRSQLNLLSYLKIFGIWRIRNIHQHRLILPSFLNQLPPPFPDLRIPALVSAHLPIDTFVHVGGRNGTFATDRPGILAFDGGDRSAVEFDWGLVYWGGRGIDGWLAEGWSWVARTR